MAWGLIPGLQSGEGLEQTGWRKQRGMEGGFLASPSSPRLHDCCMVERRGHTVCTRSAVMHPHKYGLTVSHYIPISADYPLIAPESVGFPELDMSEGLCLTSVEHIYWPCRWQDREIVENACNMGICRLIRVQLKQSTSVCFSWLGVISGSVK